MKKNLASVFLVLALATSAAVARPLERHAVVDSVQMPAWVERNGVRAALEPGAALQNRDRVTTGPGARVRIALGDGSEVKLGENAQLDLNALGRRENRVFTAAIDVGRGAVRVTTDHAAKSRQARLINVRVATITAGLRGTDLVARAAADRDLIVLFGGQITVMHEQDPPLSMSEPMSLYAAGKGEAPQLIDHLEPAQANVWATQTAIGPGSGYARRGGKWKVELADVATQADALELYDRSRAAGYAASIKPRRQQEGGYSYSVRVTQLASQAEALALVEKVASALDLASPAATRD